MASTNLCISPTLISFILCLFISVLSSSQAHPSPKLLRKIHAINKVGEYFGLVIPNTYEMNPLLQPPTFLPSAHIPYVDISGKRFHVGKVMNRSVIVVMTGLGMVNFQNYISAYDMMSDVCIDHVGCMIQINAGITTQLLLSFFSIKGVVHYGIAGNGNPDHHIGDVTIPLQWAHTGLWSWQRYGQGEKDELPLEENGDYTRNIGFLNFAKYGTSEGGSDNLLNNVWYQPDEIFPVNGVPEERQHAFWVNVSHSYYHIAKGIENLELEACLNSSSCLSHKPKVVRVKRGCSANIYLDNAAYRNFLHNKFNVTPIDMESAGVALVCHSQRKAFIIIRALSDLAGGSNEENEAATFTNLAATNAVKVVSQMIALLP